MLSKHWLDVAKLFFFFEEGEDGSRLLQLSATLVYDVSRATGTLIGSWHPVPSQHP